jgi:hypothetical protein
MPCRAITSERPCEAHPCARVPGTALIADVGCGVVSVGTPKALGDCAMVLVEAKLKAKSATASDKRFELYMKVSSQVRAFYVSPIFAAKDKSR